MRFIDQFSVLLLDMNGTFMFGEDRFGPGEDFDRTYRALGGRRLAADQVTRTIRSCCAGLLRDYEDATKQDDFPSLAEALREYGRAADEDIALLARVFSTHELGQVPAPHAAFLRRVSNTHRLGVVSNICASPAFCATAFAAAGIESLFACAVFSSAGRSIKPSPVMFRRALAMFPEGERVAFAGDSLERDIHPARALGMGTVWIAPPASSALEADRVVGSLLELERVTASQPVVHVGRRTETGEAPRRQGATTEQTGSM